MHPIVAKHLPTQKAVSNKIAQLYTAVQESLIESFKNHKGTMYLGLDAWQSPNGFDILGTVVYRLVQEDSGSFHLEAMPLDFVRLNRNHTGLYLAETVQAIVEKFGLKEKIFGIVTNNTTNNQTMIKKLKAYCWPCFKGEGQWVCCFAHILNLIAQVMLQPFGNSKKKKDSSDQPNQSFNNEDSDQEELDDLEEQIQLFNREESDSRDDDERQQDETIGTHINEDGIELKDEDVNELSDEDDGD
ncbi:hypothetical protein PCASD_16937 [Puccinia coronata f. sp. avenae]|uniref:DUF659 domain-containing protein n=2 Tax=Puccinia coronata f. sp. avenae TaxID=200324 RepID=A0A2N5SY90_9BASI|nr:hypothetical protein PCASD_16937 [Puccinia coronata f. sp. avenae]